MLSFAKFIIRMNTSHGTKTLFCLESQDYYLDMQLSQSNCTCHMFIGEQNIKCRLY